MHISHENFKTPHKILSDLYVFPLEALKRVG